MAAKRRPTGIKKGIKTKGWGKYSPEQSARAAHLRTNPGDVYWSTAPRKSTVRLDMPPGWTFVERICNGPNGTARKYKVYLGPNGEQAPSIPQAWRKYESSAGAEAAVQVYGKRKKAAPAAAPAAAAEEGGDSSEADAAADAAEAADAEVPARKPKKAAKPALARTPAEVVAMLKPKAKAAEPDSSDEDA